MDFCLAMLLLLRVCFVASFLSLVVASHHHRDQDGLGEGGEIVIEHRHRPRVHKSYGSGQYVIPAAALLPQHQHHLGDDQEPQDLGGQDGDYLDDFNEDDTEELHLAVYSDEQSNNIGKLGLRGSEAIFENILGSDNLASNGSGKSKDKRDRGADGESEKVEKKEGSRAALRKLLRLLIAAYI